MLCGIVKRYCLLIVRSAFHYVSRVQADQAAPLKMRAGLQAPLGQRAELRLLSAATSPSLAREDATPLQAASDASPSLTSEDATALHAARNGLRKNNYGTTLPPLGAVEGSKVVVATLG